MRKWRNFLTAAVLLAKELIAPAESGTMPL